MELLIVYKCFAFIFGALIGSFGNVLIHRLPREMDFIFKRSHCPSCKNVVRWFDNIPIFSFIILRGKCRYCRNTISWRYPVVEFILGLAALLLFPESINGINLLHFALYFFIAFSFVVHFFIDLEFNILPDGINLLLGAIFLTLTIPSKTWHFWLLGPAIGIFFPSMITWIYFKIRGVIGLGGGDIKLFGALGIILGPIGIIHNIFLSCFLGSIVGLILIIVKKVRKDVPIPFGPFIIVVASIQIFLHNEFNQLLKLIF